MKQEGKKVSTSAIRTINFHLSGTYPHVGIVAKGVLIIEVVLQQREREGKENKEKPTKAIDLYPCKRGWGKEHLHVW